MKFDETPVSTQFTVYLKERLRELLKVDVGDVLEWHVNPGKDQGSVVVSVVKKKEN